MNWIVVLALGPLITALLLLTAWSCMRLQRTISVCGVFFLLGLSLYAFSQTCAHGPLVSYMGGWPAPYGIVLVLDMLSAAMLVVSMIIATAAVLYTIATAPIEHERPLLYPFIFVMLMGVNGAVLTGDMFNMFVFIEILLIASYMLSASGGSKVRFWQTLKYAVLNTDLPSFYFILALAFTYSVFGTVNIAQLAERMNENATSMLVLLPAVLYLLVFGTKAALFPVYFWLPGPYNPPPAGIAALFGGLLTKVGVYALFRMYALSFHQIPGMSSIFLVVASATIVFGVLGALSHTEVNRILSYHIISQIGYMIMGIGLGTPEAFAGAMYYILHHMLVKANLFLTAGAVKEIYGTDSLYSLGGIATRTPLLAAVFSISALSLAGVPPLSGFWAKLGILWGGAVPCGAWVSLAFGFLGSILTLLSMLKIYCGAYLGAKSAEPRTGNGSALRARVPGMCGMLLLTFCTLALSIGAFYFYPFAEAIGAYLIQPQLYINAVLQNGG
jgi:multicomponent Na+:H+ antiporter subunit D